MLLTEVTRRQARGKVIDFNLMLRKGRCTGHVVPLRMEEGEGCDIRSILTFEMPEYEAVMIYCYKGTLAVTLDNGENYRLEDGDTLKLTGRFDKAGWSCSAETVCGSGCVGCSLPVMR